MSTDERRSMRAAKRLADWLLREHGLQLDDFDAERMASAIEVDTGVREMEIMILNTRQDLARILEGVTLPGGQ